MYSPLMQSRANFTLFSNILLLITQVNLRKLERRFVGLDKTEASKDVQKEALENAKYRTAKTTALCCVGQKIRALIALWKPVLAQLQEKFTVEFSMLPQMVVDVQFIFAS